MARFSGSGILSIAGTNTRIYDVIMAGASVVAMAAGEARNVDGKMTVSGPVRLRDCNLTSLTVTADDVDMQGCHLTGSSDGCVWTGADGLIVGNTFFENGTLTNNTYDSLRVTGNRNQVMSNRFIPATGSTRYGVNIVSGECNMIVGNDLGDPDDYATDALNDGGANTQLFWPADATYGDNYTDCGSGS